jgi:archaellum component FlaC
MPSNEVDELYVSLSLQMEEFEDEVEEAADEIDQFERRLNRSMRGSQDEIDDTAGEVSVLKARLDALDGNTVEIDTRLDADETRAQLQALDSKEIDVEVATDANRSTGGGRRRGAGAAFLDVFDEAGELARAFTQLDIKTQALIGGFTAATASLVAVPAAVGGLTAAATAAAAQFGSVEIRRDLNALKEEFRGTAAALSDAFEPIIRSSIIPAARGLADAFRDLIPMMTRIADGAAADLAAFLAQEVLGAFVSLVAIIRGMQEAFETLREAMRETWDFLSSPTSDESRFEVEMGRDERVQFEGPSTAALEGARRRIQKEDIRPALSEARAVISSLQAGEVGIEDARSELSGLRSQLLRTLRTIRQNPARIFPPGLLTQTKEDLNEIQGRLREISVRQTGSSQDATAVEPAGTDISTPQPAQLDLAEIGQQRQREAQHLQRALDTALSKAQEFFQAIRPAVLQGIQSLADGIGRSLGGALFADPEQLQRLRDRRRNIQQNLRQARNAGNFKQVRQLSKELDRVNSKLEKTEGFFSRMGEAFRNFGNIARQVLEQLISELVSAAALALILTSIPGLSSAGFGSVFGAALSGGKIPGLAKGGIVTGPTLAMIGEGPDDEAVVPLSRLESMIKPDAVPQKAGVGGAGVDVSVNLATEARIEGSDLVVGVRNALNEEAAVGGPGTL